MTDKTTEALKLAEQDKQEPVAVISESAIGLVKLHANGVSLPFGTPLYAAPVSAPKQEKQEPVAWVSEDVCEGQYIDGRTRKIWLECKEGIGMAIYAAPVSAKREWVELTVSDLDAIIEKHYDDEMDLKAMILDGIAAYKEKNK